ncbi:9827_t:CDS:2 [Cetraspora pellucida]|uniref:9827_t:CDS:1 n=1 Tax=Cetraspora pellucida TaxID=1433469 RepID=A0A9N8W1Y1_9GLOM|nr:9827_t:CDS:2 [Cetraspora pellucida]
MCEIVLVKKTLTEGVHAVKQESQLDYENSFLENQLDRPQISIIALIKDINPNDIVEQDKELGLQQSINISMTFQQKATDIIIPDLHIIEQIRNTNVNNTKGQQIANKKVRYANGFRKMKKALNTALNLSCEQELIDMVTYFVEQKKFELENINNEDTHSGQPEKMVVMHLLVIKHHR